MAGMGPHLRAAQSPIFVVSKLQYSALRPHARARLCPKCLWSGTGIRPVLSSTRHTLSWPRLSSVWYQRSKQAWHASRDA